MVQGLFTPELYWADIPKQSHCKTRQGALSPTWSVQHDYVVVVCAEKIKLKMACGTFFSTNRASEER